MLGLSFHEAAVCHSPLPRVAREDVHFDALVVEEFVLRWTMDREGLRHEYLSMRFVTLA